MTLLYVWVQMPTVKGGCSCGGNGQYISGAQQHWVQTSLMGSSRHHTFTLVLEVGISYLVHRLVTWICDVSYNQGTVPVAQKLK